MADGLFAAVTIGSSTARVVVEATGTFEEGRANRRNVNRPTGSAVEQRGLLVTASTSRRSFLSLGFGLSSAALLLSACTTGQAPKSAASTPTTPVEVSGYGTEQRDGHRVFSAEYTIHNATRAPVEYKVAFLFLDGDGLASAPKWVTRTVKAGHSYNGRVWVPWEGRQGSTGVKVMKVYETPL
ncbi:hypothetical protein OHA71_49200 [Streptomyces sp. NBC_00444]|uniref:hypothetical protein n=1 Tax=Streptomyces sp. NBC_00444 TaxID=2975744 RepID=UPI002E1E48B6